MQPDFPAAHSMDTLWFAVDRDGHVAAFQSGEAGAVPVSTEGQESGDRLADELRQLLPVGTYRHDLGGRLLPSQPGREKVFAFPGTTVLMFFSSLEPVQSMLDGGRAIEVPATEGFAVLLLAPNEAELESLRDGPECRACYSMFLLDDPTADRSLARHGVFEYMHLTENWISGPYGREAVPAQPIHIDQLPPRLRERLELVRLDQFRFADTPHIQPVELVECMSWESAYLDVTGQHQRPFHSEEDEDEDEPLVE